MARKELHETIPVSMYSALITAIFASLASFYFIEVRGNPAAWLCWFERMLMFGLVLVLTVGILLKDLRVKYYAYAFLFFGIPSAVLQQLVHWDIIKITQQSCSEGVVCATKFFELFGFITQATLCLTAFLIIAVCMWKLKDIKLGDK